MPANKHAKTYEEIEEFLRNNPDLGKLNGQPLVPSGVVDWQSYMSAELYNKVLFFSAGALRIYDKTRMGTILAEKFLLDDYILSGQTGLQVEKPPKADKSLIRRWRSQIPVSSYTAISAHCDRLGWDLESAVIYAAQRYTSDSSLIEAYNSYLAEEALRYQCSTVRIEQAIEETLLLVAKLKRRNLAAIGDPDAESDKLN